MCKKRVDAMCFVEEHILHRVTFRILQS